MLRRETLSALLLALLCLEGFAEASSPIKHVVVLMMENRSFDHMLGLLQKKHPKIDGITGKETMPVDCHKPTGKKLRIQTNASFAVDMGPSHSLIGTSYGIYGGSKKVKKPPMNGFITYHRKSYPLRKAREVFSAFKPSRVPIITTLATEFAVFDRYFCSVPGPTGPNRLFALSATAKGMTINDTPPGGYTQDTIFDRLDAVGKSWGIYHTLGCISCSQFQIARTAPKVQKFDAFVQAAKAGKLPSFSWVEPSFGFDTKTKTPPTCQHARNGAIPPGENFIKTVYETLRASPLWNSTALIITYDEGGGFWDHVAPPQTHVPNPDGIPPAQKVSNFNFDRLGVRVPFIVVSPWVKKGTVVHNPTGPTAHSHYEHSSIPATLHKIFGTKSFLNKRDAWAGTFEHLFTQLTHPRTDCPKHLPAVVGNIHLDGGGTKAFKRSAEGESVVELGDGPCDELVCDLIKSMPNSDKNCDRTEAEAGDYLDELTNKLLAQDGGNW